MSAIIVAGFPGIGKTEYVKKAEGRIADLEPYEFQHVGDNAAYWPANYLDVIREAASESDVVLVASYPEIITVLISEGFQVIVVYPDESQRYEYVRRYLERGNRPAIVAKLGSMFQTNISNLKVLKGCGHIVLQPGQYFSDVAEQIR